MVYRTRSGNPSPKPHPLYNSNRALYTILAMNAFRAFLGRIFSPPAVASDPEAQHKRSFIAGYQIPAPLRYCARGTVASLSFTSPTQPAVDHYFAVPQPTLHPTPPPTHERGPTEPENHSATDSDTVLACRRFYVAGIVVAFIGVAFVFVTTMCSES